MFHNIIENFYQNLIVHTKSTAIDDVIQWPWQINLVEWLSREAIKSLLINLFYF